LLGSDAIRVRQDVGAGSRQGRGLVAGKEDSVLIVDAVSVRLLWDAIFFDRECRRSYITMVRHSAHDHPSRV
jgi:hypothetical protein